MRYVPYHIFCMLHTAICILLARCYLSLLVELRVKYLLMGFFSKVDNDLVSDNFGAHFTPAARQVTFVFAIAEEISIMTCHFVFQAHLAEGIIMLELIR